MEFNLDRLLKERHGENFQLHAKYLNPQLTKVIKTLGFDRFYERGEGCYLIDDEGERYLDLLSGFGVFALGRSHPVIKDALHQAIDADLPNMVQMDCALLPGLLAEQLVTRVPANIERVFFCNSGAEAVEAAIKFARASDRSRPRSCYHVPRLPRPHARRALGQRLGRLQRGFGPLLADATEVPFGDIDALRRELKRGDVAAFIAEPIQGKGVYDARCRALARDRERRARRRGRSSSATRSRPASDAPGASTRFEHYGLTPDIITVSKALSGGYVPVGAMLASDKILRSVYSSMDRAMVHSTTFKRNQLAMVAGLATLAVFDDEGIVEHAAAMGEVWKARLARSRAPRVPPRRARQGPDDRHRVRATRTSRAARRWWTTRRGASRPAMFSQTLVVPLFHRLPDPDPGRGGQRQHHQAAAAAHRRRGRGRPLRAPRSTTLLADAERSAGWLVEFGVTMAKGAFRRNRSAEKASRDPR